MSGRTANLECKLLRQVMKAAKTWAHVADDYKPLPEDRRGPGRALEEAEERLLFDTAKQNPRWDSAFYALIIASTSTMRGHELKLRVQDVDLVDRQVIIHKSKTNAGERTIPLHDSAQWAVARLIERAQALGSVDPDHFLFPAFGYRYTRDEHRDSGYDPTRHQKSSRTAWRNLLKETARRAAQVIENEVA